MGCAPNGANEGLVHAKKKNPVRLFFATGLLSMN